MTFEQAQLIIKLFILQHYDENIDDIIPDVNPYANGKVSDLRCDNDGDWCTNDGYIFWANSTNLKKNNHIQYSSNFPDILSRYKNFDPNLYINTKEET